MKTIKFRDLTADELELRVGSTTEKGFTLLIYKTARVDANILDDTVGAFNWQKKFYQVKNTMICSLGINMNYDDESKEPYWVWKDDAGDESNTEAVKGEASDSFKRAGFAFGGIGRKLYNSPFIWINKDENNDPKKSRYRVKEIAYDETSVIKVIVVNEKTNQEFTFKQGGNTTQTSQKNPKSSLGSGRGTIRPEEIAKIKKLLSGFTPEKKDKFTAWLLERYQVSDYLDLSDEQGIMVCVSWKI